MQQVCKHYPRCKFVITGIIPSFCCKVCAATPGEHGDACAGIPILEVCKPEISADDVPQEWRKQCLPEYFWLMYVPSPFDLCIKCLLCDKFNVGYHGIGHDTSKDHQRKLTMVFSASTIQFLIDEQAKILNNHPLLRFIPQWNISEAAILLKPHLHPKIHNAPTVAHHFNDLSSSLLTSSTAVPETPRSFTTYQTVLTPPPTIRIPPPPVRKEPPPKRTPVTPLAAELPWRNPPPPPPYRSQVSTAKIPPPPSTPAPKPPSKLPSETIEAKRIVPKSKPPRFNEKKCVPATKPHRFKEPLIAQEEKVFLEDNPRSPTEKRFPAGNDYEPSRIKSVREPESENSSRAEQWSTDWKGNWREWSIEDNDWVQYYRNDRRSGWSDSWNNWRY